MNERTLTAKEAAAFLGVSPQSLNVWRCTKRYPLPYIKIGRMIRYRYSDLVAFLEQHATGDAQAAGR